MENQAIEQSSYSLTFVHTIPDIGYEPCSTAGRGKSQEYIAVKLICVACVRV